VIVRLTATVRSSPSFAVVRPSAVVVEHCARPTVPAMASSRAGSQVVSWRAVFVPIPEGPARNSKEAAEAERVRATVACIEHSGASKDRDYKMAINEAAKCAEQTR
jgi:hypothetical protein